MFKLRKERNVKNQEKQKLMLEKEKECKQLKSVILLEHNSMIQGSSSWFNG